MDSTTTQSTPPRSPKPEGFIMPPCKGSNKLPYSCIAPISPCKFNGPTPSKQPIHSMDISEKRRKDWEKFQDTKGFKRSRR